MRMWQPAILFFNFMMIGGFLLSGSSLSLAEQLPSQEYVRKAGLLYNFARFIEWPRTAYPNEDEFIIGVLGEDPFKEALEPLTEKMIEGRQIRIERYPSIEDIDFCQILYITPLAADQMKKDFDVLASRSILTVGERSDFVQSGGMIGLVEKDGEIHFEINVSSAEAAHLNISSKLLTLAQKIW
ncbi:MAG: YfiR family protein [Candidatus Omnitrophica bacterium]|nr:YfiR family protein [Candidatus Omnitrophota bacterium]